MWLYAAELYPLGHIPIDKLFSKFAFVSKFGAAAETEISGITHKPKKYGDKIKLKNLFSDVTEAFQSTNLNLYGKNEIVKYLCMDLLWKPIGRKIRFILVKTNEKVMILMCSDLCMHPESIIVVKDFLGYL